jgi:hypothetical protein
MARSDADLLVRRAAVSALPPDYSDRAPETRSNDPQDPAVGTRNG